MISAHRIGNEKGLTLIEMLVAILIFSMMTLGMVPLLASSLRGSSLSRSYTVGRNLGTQAMERARGLPFFESVKNLSPPSRQDVLDLYFPNATASSPSGYNSAERKFVTKCTSSSSLPSTSGPLACPKALPTGYSVTFEARFMEPGTVVAGKQNYQAVAPASGYSWSSVTTEPPPTSLLQLTIISEWTYGGRARSFTLDSFFSDRRLTTERLSGVANIDYVVQATTAFVDGLGRTSYLVGTLGASNSTISSRGTSAAEQTVRAARFTLTREEFGVVAGATLADVISGERVLRAPPNQNPTATNTFGAVSVVHSELTPPLIVARANDTEIDGTLTGAQVVNELPKALGAFRYVGSNSEPSFSIDNQKQAGDQFDLKLEATSPILTMERGTAGVRTKGSTSSEATALTPSGSRKVEGLVHAEFSRLRLFHTISTLPFITDTSENRAVLIISDFRADLNCRSTASGSTALAGGTGGLLPWSATLKYWRDSTNDGLKNGAYSSPISLSGIVGSGASDPLAGIGNPLVYDGTGLSGDDDVYLFKTDTTKGYLQSLASTPNVSAAKDATGRVTEARITDAIKIITYRTNSTNPASSLNVSIGSLSCRSVDKRGL